MLMTMMQKVLKHSSNRLNVHHYFDSKKLFWQKIIFRSVFS